MKVFDLVKMEALCDFAPCIILPLQYSPEVPLGDIFLVCKEIYHAGTKIVMSAQDTKVCAVVKIPLSIICY